MSVHNMTPQERLIAAAVLIRDAIEDFDYKAALAAAAEREALDTTGATEDNTPTEGQHDD